VGHCFPHRKSSFLFFLFLRPSLQPMRISPPTNPGHSFYIGISWKRIFSWPYVPLLLDSWTLFKIIEFFLRHQVLWTLASYTLQPLILCLQLALVLLTFFSEKIPSPQSKIGSFYFFLLSFSFQRPFLVISSFTRRSFFNSISHKSDHPCDKVPSRRYRRLQPSDYLYLDPPAYRMRWEKFRPSSERCLRWRPFSFINGFLLQFFLIISFTPVFSSYFSFSSRESQIADLPRIQPLFPRSPSVGPSDLSLAFPCWRGPSSSSFLSPLSSKVFVMESSEWLVRLRRRPSSR